MFANQFGHVVGQLYFAAGADATVFQLVENFWLQDVAADDGEGRWRCGGFGFFDEAFDLGKASIIAADIEDAVFIGLLARHIDHGNDIAADIVISFDHLL